MTLISVSAFFSCSETAIFSLGHADVDRIRTQSPRAAQLTSRILKEPRHFLITVMLFNEVVNVSISILLSTMVYSHLGITDWWRALIVSIAITTPILLIFCEIVPKNIAIRMPRKIVPIVIFPMTFLSSMVSILRRPLLALSDRLVRMLGSGMQVSTMLMEDELRSMVDFGEEKGVVGEEEAELIHGVFELSDCSVKDIMTPRGEVFSVASDRDLDDVLNEVKTTQFSRIPVYQDSPDEIAGIIHIKDLLSVRKMKTQGKVLELEDVIRPVLYVDQELKLDAMLKEFQRRKFQIAIVEDEDGKFIGVVTMDDVLDTLIGEKELED